MGGSSSASSSKFFACLAMGLLVGSGCSDSSMESESAGSAPWPTGDLLSVAVTTGASAVVLSSEGTLHFTRDGGAAWQRAHVPAHDGLARLSMADERHGWAVGPGVVLRTDDGGASWRRQRLPARAADFPLSGIGVIDSERAVAVGRRGRRLRTVDAGALWRDVSRIPELPSASSADFSAVACSAGLSGRCWSVGRSIESTSDVGLSWQRGEISDPVGLGLLAFRFGGVELGPEGATSVAAAVRAPHDFSLDWEIEAGVTRQEIERFARDRDPSAIFDLIDARLEEVRSVLEAAGVESDRITVSGEPPWGYEELLDDDPDLLTRYLASRVWERPGARIAAREPPVLAAIGVGRGEELVAVGASGRVYLSRDGGAVWLRVERPSSHDLLDVALVAGRIVVVGRQGRIWTRSQEPMGWTSPEIEESGPFFEALRGVDFDASGAWGVIVGDRGRILDSRDGGATWRLLKPPGGVP